jgi:hypothetical protein
MKAASTLIVTAFCTAGCFGFVSGLQGQRNVIPDAVTCGTCRVELQPIATLKDDPDRGVAFTDVAVITRSRNGNFFVTATADPYKVVEYEPSGARILRVHGRSGRGPGEVLAAGPPVFLGDTLVVADPRQQRFLLQTRDGAAIHTVAIPGRFAAYLGLPDGQFLVNAIMQHPSALGYPLHVVSRSGDLVRSFGADRASYRPEVPALHTRKLAAAPAGRFWSAGISTFEVDLYDAAGERHASFSRVGSLFQSWERTPGEPREVRPTVSLLGLWQQGNHLWITYLTPDANWRATRPPSARRREPALPPPTPEEANRIWDTVVEVIDLDSRRVLTRARFDAVMRPTYEGGLLWRYEEDAEGLPTLRVLRPVLQR